MTKRVDAKDLSSGSNSLLDAIPMELIAIVIIVPLLIILGLLAKHYHRSRYDALTAENLEPAFIPNVKTRSFQDNLRELPVVEEKLPSNIEKNSSVESMKSVEQEKVIPIKTVTKPVKNESASQPMKNESNVLFVIAKGLIIIGLLMNYFLQRRQRNQK